MPFISEISVKWYFVNSMASAPGYLRPEAFGTTPIRPLIVVTLNNLTWGENHILERTIQKKGFGTICQTLNFTAARDQNRTGTRIKSRGISDLN